MQQFSGFSGETKLAEGTLATVAVAIKRASLKNGAATFLVFDNVRGAVVDIDLRGTEADVRAAHPPEANQAPTLAHEPLGDQPPRPRNRGRPKLGVIGREVTLLPAQWDWLGAQRGGASATLRRLVSAAKKANQKEDERRACQGRAYGFMTAFLGNSPHFEEASRALFAGDAEAFADHAASWPTDLREHLEQLLVGAFDARGRAD